MRSRLIRTQPNAGSPAPALMNDSTLAHEPSARAAVRALMPSQIREVANAGLDEPGVLPFWFGEPDEVTPAFT